MHIIKAKNIMMYHYEITHDSHQEYNAFTFIFVSYTYVYSMYVCILLLCYGMICIFLKCLPMFSYGT